MGRMLVNEPLLLKRKELKMAEASKSVAEKKATNVVAFDFASLKQDVGKGNENVGKEDLALPFLKILSGVDPMLDKLEDAKKAYKIAYDAGDSEAVVTAQESLTTAKIKSDKLNNFKIPALQEENSEVQNKEGNTPPPVIDQKASSWHEKNQWYGVDDEMTSYALGLHSKLVKQHGNDYAKTDEYYSTIDARMRKLFPENFEDSETEVETETEKPKLNNVVAPATRSTAPKKVRLTQTQVNLANRLGVPLELYAKKVAEEMRKK